MQNLGQALKEAITNMTDSPSDVVHTCPFCQKVVPKLKLNVLGVEKVVQPFCKCEVDNWEKGVQEAIERKQRNDIEQRFSLSKLGERFNECTFEAFKPRKGSERAAMLAKNYAETFPVYGENGLLIWGEPGNGKSHLAAAICHVVKEKGYIPVFQSVPELLERIRSTFGNRKTEETEKEIMDALRECDLLVLDDIGAEKISDWVLDAMFRIIDGRYRKKKPIVYTTNFSPSDLLARFMPDRPTKEDEIMAKRIHDRIIETSVIVENKASSYRMEVARNRVREMTG